MGTNQQRQLRKLISKQKKIIAKARPGFERAESFGFWSGFLDGLKIAGAISKKEYDFLYAEMKDFQEAAWEDFG